jgi:hypothetical protein
MTHSYTHVDLHGVEFTFELHFINDDWKVDRVTRKEVKGHHTFTQIYTADEFFDEFDNSMDDALSNALEEASEYGDQEE